MDSKVTAIYFYVIVSTLFLALILLFYLLSFIRHQKKFQELIAAKASAEINTLETERKRIARDLHDDLGPVLSAAKYLLQSMEDGSESDTRLRDEALSYIDKTIVQMRQIARAMMPESLVSKGLPFAIREFIDTSIKIDLTIQFTHATIGHVPKHTALHVYHIVQEIVHNIIKHSGASQCTVHLEVVNNTLVIQTSDNGSGYNQADMNLREKGLGMSIMQSRIALLNGEADIVSEVNKGTQHYITIPLS